jgi:hypothetical protein
VSIFDGDFLGLKKARSRIPPLRQIWFPNRNVAIYTVLLLFLMPRLFENCESRSFVMAFSKFAHADRRRKLFYRRFKVRRCLLGPQRQSRDGASDSQRVRVVAGESGRQIDAQILTLLGPNKRIGISQQVNFCAGLHRKGFERCRGRFGLSQEDCVGGGLLLCEPDRNAFSGVAGSAFPRMSCVDGFAVCLQPRTQSFEPVHLNIGNGAVGFGTNIEEKVPVLTDDVHQ